MSGVQHASPATVAAAAPPRPHPPPPTPPGTPAHPDAPTSMRPVSSFGTYSTPKRAARCRFFSASGSACRAKERGRVKAGACRMRAKRSAARGVSGGVGWPAQRGDGNSVAGTWGNTERSRGWCAGARMSMWVGGWTAILPTRSGRAGAGRQESTRGRGKAERRPSAGARRCAVQNVSTPQAPSHPPQPNPTCGGFHARPESSGSPKRAARCASFACSSAVKMSTPVANPGRLKRSLRASSRRSGRFSGST